MVSRWLPGCGTARSMSYRRLEDSRCDNECAPRSTCTFPSALGVEQGPRHSHIPTSTPYLGLCTPCTCTQATHTSSRQCAALSTHCSATRKPPHTCLPFTCTEAM